MRLIYLENILTAFIISEIYLLCTFKVSALQCVKAAGSECKCVIEDTGRYIDLAPIAQMSQSYKAQSAEFTYEWEPCTLSGFTCASHYVSVCQRATNDPTKWVYAAGGPSSTFDLTKDPPTISYTSISDITRTTIISLTCNGNGGTPSFGLINEGTNGIYTFNLQSKYACIFEPSGPTEGPEIHVSVGLSVGSILLIICLIFVILYIAGGSGFNLFYRHNSGVAQVLPNTPFWLMLPGLIKDGCLFIVCKGGSSSYQKV